MAATQSQLLLGLYLVATLAVFAAASGSVASSCDGTKEALLKARDKCCNALGERGKCIGICSAAKEVFDSVTFLHLCNNYDACSASWNWKNDVATSDGAATDKKEDVDRCSSDHLKSAVEQCSKVVKPLKDLAFLKNNSGDECFKGALDKLGLDNNLHAVIKNELLQPGN